jgi:hypothetical protein
MGKDNQEPLKPGQPAQQSGIYEIIGPRGGQTGKERTIVQGEPMPPTPQSGQRYRLSRPAHNGSGDK